MSAAVKLCPQCGSEYSADIKFCPKDGTTLRVPLGAALIGSVIADRYHIIKKLGEGGMGQVFLAEHVKMGRPSAIKIMTPGMMQDADAISRFNREAANASRITHPNVAAIYDFGETSDGLIYLAMEYVEGESLTNLLAHSGTLAPARAASVIRQTASALDAAHERGIVHRDLKPDNIMIARNRDGTDLVKVVDFGIAKAAGGAGQKVTKTGLVVGTPEYMSPEQLAGDAVDARSDTYALALVAFHVLTGTLPFAGGSAQETMIRRLTDKPRTLSEVHPGAAWPPALEDVIGRALERDASHRPATASEFASGFSRAVEGMEDRSEGATKVLSAVPATRIDGGSSAIGHRPSATRVTATKPKKRGLIYAGVGVAVAAGVLVAVTRGPTPKVTEKAALPAQQFSKPIDSGAIPDTSPTTLPVATKTPDHPAVKPAAKTVPPAAPPAAPPTPKPFIVVPPNTRPGPESRAGNASIAAVRARRGVDTAASLIEQGEPNRALLILMQAIPYLPSHEDSVGAALHVAEALLMKAEKEGDAAPKKRACHILTELKMDPGGYLAASVNALYDNGGCK